MAFTGKSTRKQYTAVGEDAQFKFKQDLSRFEQSVKEIQTCLKSLNESVAELYGESLPRAAEFRRGLQDENTLVGNLVRDTHGVEDRLLRYKQEYDDGNSSVVASANRSSEFVTSVLGALFKGQNVFFSESLKVSQVLLDIVSQTKHTPTPRETKLARELQDKLDGKPPIKEPAGRLPGSGFAAREFSVPAGGHRGPGALADGAYGSQKPQSKGLSTQIKPASRFSSPPSTISGGTRIYI